MAPEKNKRPLPSSTSFILPERPITYQQWRTALQHVKILYLRGQVKECASQCSQYLREARTTPLCLHATYIHFYCALSNEATARLSHPLSTVKLHILDQARTSYTAAASSLPIVDRVLDCTEVSVDDDSWSVHSFPTSAGSGILDYYRSSPGVCGPHDEPSSPSSVESGHFSQDLNAMKPLPLRIRKSSLPGFESTVDNSDTEPFFRAFTQHPSTSPSIHPPSTTPEIRPCSSTFQPSNSLWLRVCAREHYKAHLLSFTEMLSNHISTIDNLIDTTRQAQAMRYLPKRLASYAEDEAAKKADRQARIVRLKAAGWKRARFRPEKYQDLCQRALEEL